MQCDRNFDCGCIDVHFFSKMTTNARIWMQRAKICISWFFIFFTSFGWLASMYFSLWMCYHKDTPKRKEVKKHELVID